MSGSTPAIASRKPGSRSTEKNAPEMNTIGRYTAVTTADEPSPLRTAAVSASPSAANDSVPSSTATAKPPPATDRSAPIAKRPIRSCAPVWSAITSTVERITAARYAAAGSGVPRTRLSTPDSRRITRWIASPANAVATIP